MTTSVGDLIRERREARGWSAAELAQRCGLHRSIISKLERGLRAPSPDTLIKVAETLEVDPEELQRAAGAMAPTALPSLRPYLRTKYRHLPESKLRELSEYFERVAAEYEEPNQN